MTLMVYKNYNTGELAHVALEYDTFSMIFGNGIGKGNSVDCKKLSTVVKHLEKRGYDTKPIETKIYLAL